MMSAFSPVNSLKIFDGLDSNGILRPNPPLPAPLAAPVSRPSSDFVLAAPAVPAAPTLLPTEFGSLGSLEIVPSSEFGLTWTGVFLLLKSGAATPGAGSVVV